MRNKASLSLMEQLVMLLVFSLAAALCLGVFARAQSVSQETVHRETAAQIAQNGAEWLKSGGALEELSVPQGYTARLICRDSAVPGLRKGEIEVCFAGEPVFSLETAWQEVSP